MVNEEDTEEEFDEDEEDTIEEFEEELENIIDDTKITEIPSFKQAALEEILPSLQPIESPINLEQGVRGTIIEQDDEDNDNQNIYELANPNQNQLGIYSSKSDYFSAPGDSYNVMPETLNRMQGTTMNTNIQDFNRNPWSQDRGADSLYQGKSQKEKNLEEDRRRRNW